MEEDEAYKMIDRLLADATWYDLMREIYRHVLTHKEYDRGSRRE